MIAPPKKTKSANLVRYKSPSCDALTAQAIEASARTGALGVELQSVVLRDDTLRTTRATTATTATTLLPWKKMGANRSSSTKTRAHSRWLDTANATPKAHTRCPAWRETTDVFKAHLSHVALSLDGNAWSFNLNLRHDIAAKAVGAGDKATRWLSNRLGRCLKGVLGRAPLFWFRVEESDGRSPYLHLHGELACTPLEGLAVRKALRDAGGEFAPGVRRFQVKMTREPDTNWVGYAMKIDCKRGLRIVSKLQGRSLESSWRDDNFFISQDLSRCAKTLYEDVRDRLRIKSTPWRLAA